MPAPTRSNSMPTMWLVISGRRPLRRTALSRCSANCASRVAILINMKLPPFFSSIGNMVKKLEAAGAAGVSLFNRFYQPDIDVDGMRLNTPSRRPSRWMPFRRCAGWRYCMDAPSVRWGDGRRAQVRMRSSCCSPVRTWYICHALLQQGPDLLGRMRSELEAWMEQQGFEQLSDFRGRMEPDQRARPPRTTSASTTSACSTATAAATGCGADRVYLRPADSCGYPGPRRACPVPGRRTTALRPAQ